MAIHPWTPVRSETVAKKYGKELRAVVFLNPLTNKEEEFYLFGQQDWSVILPITEDGDVVVIKQYKQGCNCEIVEVPAGTADFHGETPEEVARRELLEETGYEPEHVIFLEPPLWIAARNSWTRFHPFLATGCRKVEPAKMDASEEIESFLISWEQWLNMCQTEVEEPSAVVATFRAKPYIDALLRAR